MENNKRRLAAQYQTASTPAITPAVTPASRTRSDTLQVELPDDNHHTDDIGEIEISCPTLYVFLLDFFMGPSSLKH